MTAGAPPLDPPPGDARTPLGRLLDLDGSQTSPGHYQVGVDDAWTVVHIHGGVLGALAARMAEHSRPSEAMRVTGVNATYFRPLAAGPVDGAVTWLRAGRAAAQAAVDPTGPDGELAVRLTVVLAAPRDDGIETPSRPRPIGALGVEESAATLPPLVAESQEQLPFPQQTRGCAPRQKRPAMAAPPVRAAATTRGSAFTRPHAPPPGPSIR